MSVQVHNITHHKVSRIDEVGSAKPGVDESLEGKKSLHMGECQNNSALLESPGKAKKIITKNNKKGSIERFSTLKNRT